MRIAIRLALCALMGLPGMRAYCQSNLPMAAHWGASMLPTFSEKTQVGLTTLDFTQFDGKGHQYGLHEEDSALIREGLLQPHVYYRETVGPVIATIARSGYASGRGAAFSNLYYRAELGLGADWEDFPRSLQNSLHLGWLHIPEVNRAAVRCGTGFELKCLDYTVSGELNYRVPNISQDGDLLLKPSPLFFGIGGALTSFGWEGYAQGGVKDIKLFPKLFDNFRFAVPESMDWLLEWWWGRLLDCLHFRDVQMVSPRISVMSRWGVLWNEGPTRTFEKLNPGYVINQAGFELILLPKKFPISIQNLVSAHSGIFVDSRDQPMHELFWSLKISVGDYHLETANDLINGKDSGPTFHAGAYFDIPDNWWLSRFTDRISGLTLSDWE
jgi:hypothetical protein